MNGVLELLSRPRPEMKATTGDPYLQIGMEGMMSGNGGTKGPSANNPWPNIVAVPITTATATSIPNSSNALHKMLAELAYNATSSNGGGSSSSSNNSNSNSNLEWNT